MRPLLLALALLSSPALLAGCKSSCRQLAEKLCDCSPNTEIKELCLQQAQRRESNLPEALTPEQEETCAALYEKCHCEQLEDPDNKTRADAKKNCGLARSTGSESTDGG